MQFIKSSLQMIKRLDTRFDIRRNVLTLHFWRCRFQLKTMYLKLWKKTCETLKWALWKHRLDWRWKDVEEFGSRKVRKVRKIRESRCAGRESRAKEKGEWLTMKTILLRCVFPPFAHSKNSEWDYETFHHNGTEAVVQHRLWRNCRLWTHNSTRRETGILLHTRRITSNSSLLVPTRTQHPSLIP